MPARLMIWLGRLPSGKLCRSLMLPLLLLFAQHGELLHELSHYATPETQQDSGEQHPRAGHCDLCLVFAQLDSTAVPDAPAVHLLDELSFLEAAGAPVSEHAAERPALRNRGPPTIL